MRHSIEQIEIAARPTSQLSFQHLIKLVKSIHFFKEIMCYTSKPRTGWNWTCLRIFSSMSLFHWFVKCVLSVNTSIDSAGCALSKVLWLQLDLVSSWAENDRKLVGVSKDGAGAARKFAVTLRSNDWSDGPGTKSRNVVHFKSYWLVQVSLTPTLRF